MTHIVSHRVARTAPISPCMLAATRIAGHTLRVPCGARMTRALGSLCNTTAGSGDERGRVILSGIQPTGRLHMGNVLGAVRNWVRMQEGVGDRVFYSVVDLHSITVPQDPRELRQRCLDMTAALLACGVDPERSVLFVQSHVLQHAELSWMLSCLTPLSWLERMTQFKAKQATQQRQQLGLFAYPVLQAADILCYRATHVPVGEDQHQHLELARDVAHAFNSQYAVDLFPLPQAISGDVVRVMSLRDGTQKMSKSDASDLSRLNMDDDADTIAKKIRKARTDSVLGISYDRAARPGVSNLVDIFAAVSGRSVQDICDEYAASEHSRFKATLADQLVEMMCPIGDRIRDFSRNKDYLTGVLAHGADQARVVASATLSEAKDAVGLLPVASKSNRRAKQHL